MSSAAVWGLDALVGDLAGESDAQPPLLTAPSPSLPAVPNDLDEDWTFAFSRLQKDLPQNPSKAKYGDNWELVMQSEPGVAAAWRTGLKNIIGSLDYTNQTVSGLDYAAPFTRLCVPVSKSAKFQFYTTQTLTFFPLYMLAVSPGSVPRSAAR